MDRLAFELLTEVAFFACTDGGYTGCSLALVNKRIHAASRPARFFSVSLMFSPAKIGEFVDRYEDECARHAYSIPRVRHLCLSLGSDVLPAQNGVLMPAPEPEVVPELSKEASGGGQQQMMMLMMRRAAQWRARQTTLDERFRRVIPALFHAVSRDLYTFTLMQVQWRDVPFIDCEFPHLRELMLVGGDPKFLPLLPVTPERPPLFPKLERLHHVLAHVGKDVDYARWAEHAPLVTHLRLSQLDYHPQGTVESFMRTYSPEVPEDGEQLFPRLEKVIVELHAPPPRGGYCGTPNVSYGLFSQRLYQSARDARVPVTIIPARPPSGPQPAIQDCIGRVRNEFLMGVKGQASCWTVEELADELDNVKLGAGAAQDAPAEPAVVIANADTVAPVAPAAAVVEVGA